MTTAAWYNRLRTAWERLATRHPQLRWVKKWGISAGSLVSGVLTLLVFRRGLEYFPWFVGYLLLLWLVGVALAQVRQGLAARGRRALSMVVDYTVQTLFHGLLLFLLPIYYASTTLTSRNVLFLALLATGAILTAIDPWYQVVMLRFRQVELLLFGFGLFASLNVAFPLLGLQSAYALILSGIGSVLALIPVFRRGEHTLWRTAVIRAGICAIFVALLLWPMRDWIPPVPLQLARGTFARAVGRLEPEQPVSTLTVDELRSWQGITAFTAITAPAGLRERIYHVWRKNGAIVARIPLSPISGGRPGGFRTYSRKVDMGENPVGAWTVDVLTAHDRLVGRIRLAVTP